MLRIVKILKTKNFCERGKRLDSSNKFFPLVLKPSSCNSYFYEIDISISISCYLIILNFSNSFEFENDFY